MRLLWICILACFSFGASLRYFAGASMGFGSPTLEIEERELGNVNKVLEVEGKTYIASINGGVMQYWDSEEFVGGRVLGEFGVGVANVNQTIGGVFALFGALDLLVDFYKDRSYNLGIFGGFEYGINFLVSNSRLQNYAFKSETYSAYWRIGVGVTLENLHRIEVLYKTPISPLSLPTEVIDKVTRHQVFSGPVFSIGYKILFW